MDGPSVRHIIFVCQVFYPDSQSTSQLFTELFRRVAATGRNHLMVLSGYPSSFREQSGPVSQHEWHDGIEIFRCGLALDFKKSMFSRFMAYVSYLLHTFWRLMRAPRDSLIFGVTNPPFLGILLWIVRRLRGLRFMYLMHDLHPDGLFINGEMNPRSLASRLWMWLNRRAYAAACRLIVLGRDMKRLLCDQYGIDAGRIVYMPNWSVLRDTAPTTFEKSPLARTLGLSGKFVVQYSGNMGLWHDMDMLVRAAERLRNDPRIHFLFVGNGIRRAAAEHLSAELRLPNVTWLKFTPREQLGESLACCHVSVVSLRAGLEGIAVPSKLYGILASGRAILAQVPGPSEVAMVVREEDCGALVEPGDLDGLVARILELAQDRDRVERMGRRAFAAYRAKYTVERAQAAFEALAWLDCDAAPV